MLEHRSFELFNGRHPVELSKLEWWPSRQLRVPFHSAFAGVKSKNFRLNFFQRRKLLLCFFFCLSSNFYHRRKNLFVFFFCVEYSWSFFVVLQIDAQWSIRCERETATVLQRNAVVRSVQFVVAGVRTGNVCGRPVYQHLHAIRRHASVRFDARLLRASGFVFVVAARNSDATTAIIHAGANCQLLSDGVLVGRRRGGVCAGRSVDELLHGLLGRPRWHEQRMCVHVPQSWFVVVLHRATHGPIRRHGRRLLRSYRHGSL